MRLAKKTIMAACAVVASSVVALYCCSPKITDRPIIIYDSHAHPELAKYIEDFSCVFSHDDKIISINDYEALNHGKTVDAKEANKRNLPESGLLSPKEDYLVYYAEIDRGEWHRLLIDEYTYYAVNLFNAKTRATVPIVAIAEYDVGSGAHFDYAWSEDSAVVCIYDLGKIYNHPEASLPLFYHVPTNRLFSVKRVK